MTPRIVDLLQRFWNQSSMANRPRYVLDTNVIVSALLFSDSQPGRSFSEARKRGDILLSSEVVKEITEVLRRPKFDRFVLPGKRDRFLAALIREAKHVVPSEIISACRDPKDNKWLELAVAGNSSTLITRLTGTQWLSRHNHSYTRRICTVIGRIGIDPNVPPLERDFDRLKNLASRRR